MLRGLRPQPVTDRTPAHQRLAHHVTGGHTNALERHPEDQLVGGLRIQLVQRRRIQDIGAAGAQQRHLRYLLHRNIDVVAVLLPATAVGFFRAACTTISFSVCVFEVSAELMSSRSSCLPPPPPLLPLPPPPSPPPRRLHNDNGELVSVPFPRPKACFTAACS